MLQLVWLILAGFAGGVLAGLLGIGGGIIYVLILPYVLTDAGIPNEYLAQYTIANSIFGVLFASLSANYLNIRKHDFYLRESVWVGIPGALCSLLVLKMVVVQPWYSVKLFSVVLIIFLIYMLISLFLPKDSHEIPDIDISGKLPLCLAGIAGGGLAASTGLGGGAAVVPLLTTRLHMKIKKARSISLAMITITALALTIVNLFQDPGIEKLTFHTGLIYFPAAMPVTLGVVLGSPTGNKLGRIMSDKTIKILFAGFIFMVILEKMNYIWPW